MDGSFQQLLHTLSRPEAFPYPVSEEIQVIQTHASAVLLAADTAYKLKKPEDFGFFDYSTPALRRHFCSEEVRLNARLAPHIYRGVSPVVALPQGGMRFGPTVPYDRVPEPGAVLDGGRVVDYAVAMVRLPDEATLEALVRADQVDMSLLQLIAQRMAAFHAGVQTNEHIAQFGKPGVIRANWEENFEQMHPYQGRTLDASTCASIAGYVRDFIQRRERLFSTRVRDGCIRDCHGDVRLQHVYWVDAQAAEGDRLAIIDCIEFNERFRYGDVAAEIAFLAMELDAAGRPDLSRGFVDAYVVASGDEALRELLPFYACYRACVRGKVLSFQLDQPEVPVSQRQAAARDARAFFELAARYAETPPAPMLLLVGGLMGTGKSTLATALGTELGCKIVSSDVTRKRLAGVSLTEPHADAFGAGLYTADVTARTYEAMVEEASGLLADGRSVILDASFARHNDRRAAARIASQAGARAAFIECQCPRDVALARLADRWRRRAERREESAGVPSRASDGRPELYDAQRATWEAVTPDEAAKLEWHQIITTSPPEVCIEQLLDALGIPRFACWLQDEPAVRVAI